MSMTTLGTEPTKTPRGRRAIALGTGIVLAIVLLVLASALGGTTPSPTIETGDPVGGDPGIPVEQPAEPAEPAPAAEEPARQSQGGLEQGIGVHGEWIIDVYNPDGTLDEHHEFSNDLADTGAFLLQDLLTDPTLSVTGWALRVRNSGGSSLDPCGSLSGCIISPAEVLCCLVGGGFTVTGSANATQDGSINSVATRATVYDGSTSTAPVFTQTLLSPAIDVVAGQQIQVEVTITFGTLSAA